MTAGQPNNLYPLMKVRALWMTMYNNEYNNEKKLGAVLDNRKKCYKRWNAKESDKQIEARKVDRAFCGRDNGTMCSPIDWRSS